MCAGVEGWRRGEVRSEAICFKQKETKQNPVGDSIISCEDEKERNHLITICEWGRRKMWRVTGGSCEISTYHHRLVNYNMSQQHTWLCEWVGPENVVKTDYICCFHQIHPFFRMLKQNRVVQQLHTQCADELVDADVLIRVVQSENKKLHQIQTRMNFKCRNGWVFFTSPIWQNNPYKQGHPLIQFNFDDRIQYTATPKTTRQRIKKKQHRGCCPFFALQITIPSPNT